MKQQVEKEVMSQEKVEAVRERRYFSETMRKFILKEIEEGIYSSAEASRVYKVSKVSLYKWRLRYSLNYQKGIVKVVELESESVKRKDLERQLSQVHRLTGEQAVELAFYKKLLELISNHYEFDFKKNINGKSLDGIEAMFKSAKVRN